MAAQSVDPKRPTMKAVRLALGSSSQQDGSRAVDQEHSQIDVSTLANSPQRRPCGWQRIRRRLIRHRGFDEVSILLMGLTGAMEFAGINRRGELEVTIFNHEAG